jgi:hypothetical protein
MTAMITGTNSRCSPVARIVSLLHSIPGHLFAENRFEEVNNAEDSIRLMHRMQLAALFDHSIRGHQQPLRDRQPQRFRSSTGG